MSEQQFQSGDDILLEMQIRNHNEQTMSTVFVNVTIVEAIDQPLAQMPTRAMLELIPLMPQVTHDSACIIAAPLPLLKVSAHYAFHVRIPNGVVIPCQEIVTLIKSTTASKPVNIGHGYKLVTTDIEDFLATDVEQLAAERKKKVYYLVYMHPGQYAGLSSGSDSWQGPICDGHRDR